MRKYTRRQQTNAVRPNANDITPAAEQTAPAAEPKVLGLKVRNAIRKIHDTFTAYARDFSVLQTKREDFAPKFVKVMRMWQGETSGSVAAFCRLFDETVPMDTKGYRAHSTYRAADYLIRLVSQQERARVTPTEQAERVRNAPASARTALLQLIASIAPLLSEEAKASLYKSLEDRLHWSERQADALKADVQNVAPLVLISAPRGVHVEGELKVKVAPEAEAPLARTA